jgi:methionyl-tRNA synthetase
MKKPYYISTAIAYASAKPHIGNTYEIILADAIARYKRLYNFDVYFQTGTDEHGEKIEGKAKEAKQETQEYVDDISLEIRRIWDVVNTTYDSFVRTTNPHHKEVVARIFEKLYNQGDIYKGNYEGLYCTPCESFYTESQLIEGKCPDCGREVHKASEEAYFLKASKYGSRLEQHIIDNPKYIQPDIRKNEMINNFLKPGLQDLCVSRTSFKWGVPVSFDNKHVVYVWIDALSNYITFLGYDVNEKDEEFTKYWPADLHLVGKDILRFHAIYWSIILMALDLPLPKQIFAHPWVLMGDGKMSKSKGNLLYADDLVKDFGVDAVRYYLLSEIPYANDGTLTYELLIERINSDLANILGNLVNRTIAMVHKYFDGIVVEPNKFEKIDSDVIELVLSTKEKVDLLMDDLKVGEALSEIFNIFRRCNKYIDETTPWVVYKEEKSSDRLATIMYVLLESIRQGAVLLQPFLPDTADQIFEQLNTENKYIESLEGFNGLDSGIKLEQPTPMFARINKEAKLKEISER